MFEIQFPRMQVVSANNPGGDRSSKVKCDEEKQVLEAEIQDWWQTIDEHVDKLSLTEINKDLPPLPDSDDEDEEEPVSKGVYLSPIFSHSTPPTAQVSNALPSFSSGYTIWNNLKNFARTVPYPPSVPCRAVESRVLLARLRSSFKESKEGLRNQVVDTPVSSLNDARQKFRSSAQGALKRLSVWQKKHVPGAPEYLAIKNPGWWSNCHAVPGGRVLVREGESGSIIAFTLSSSVYQRELTYLSSPSRHTQSRPSNPSLFQSQDSISPSPSPRPETSKTLNFVISPDPDLDDSALWSQQETEACVVTIARCEHPREESILGLRDVFRAANASDPSTSALNPRFTQESNSRGTPVLFPLSVRAQPQVQVSLNAADGELMQSLNIKSVETLSDSRLSHDHIFTSASSPQDHDRAPIPLLSQEYGNLGRNKQKYSSDMMISQDMKHEVFLAAPQPVPVSSNLQIARASTPTQGGSLTETLTNAMRYLLTSGVRPPSRAPSPAPSSTLHSLLAYDTLFSIDEQPHIRLDCTIGQRLKFSCTVYYAKQFDLLRKRCGVDTDIIKSLQQSENWSMDGGKSKSNFWRSLDKRFIIKTLVNAWNVSDLQVLIELAPSYFRYIDSTATKASALAKLLGFYTVEVKNLDTGVVQMKHDVLVMENLFYKHTISRIYDLKGINSRKVKIKAEQSRDKTLYDVEWNETQEQEPLLFRSYSAYILQESLRADTEFLARSNIMDYSYVYCSKSEAK
ncbi:hypothetical protein Clacol_004784 [Clathrus columnatus]|uniref:PIPK domain-containing protein n=1 Tax=Clathrus columnatus TaxID=1419009 RepID=A0AAV5AAE8_9AGAM|nr:hypothetical protein Clacol_004784 [Clathrus columnatus]